MSKPLREAMEDLDAAVHDVRAAVWEHRWGLLAYLGGLWLLAVLLAVAFEF